MRALKAAAFCGALFAATAAMRKTLIGRKSMKHSEGTERRPATCTATAFRAQI